MATIHIDGNAFKAHSTDNLLKTALSLGFNLPYFCWHPCLDSVGACRQCAVKQYRDENDERGKIVMACMTPASDGTRISIDDPEAQEFRASIIEWLMINHPHDCPVCEEGGECHLQDMTLMTGHTRRRFRGTKRTHFNQNLGPFISHEMNRCIACYRCTRYYRDYAGGDDLDVFGAHHHVYFGRHEDGTLENEFSGNLVEVCPTGVFTDKTLGAQYMRKWDLQAAPSICQHCSLGCNISPGSRKGKLKRIQNRYHGEINGYFLCDRGRFGGGFNNRDDRPRTPLLKLDGTLTLVSKTQAMEYLGERLKNAKKIIGIGSPRASLEANYTLKLLVGEANYSTGMAANEQAVVKLAQQLLAQSPKRNISMHDAEKCDAILVLGEDLTNSAPRMALSLRQAVRGRAFEVAQAHKIPTWHDRAVRDIAQGAHHPLYQATVAATRLDDVATTRCATPADIAKLGFAVANKLSSNAPAPVGLSPELNAFAAEIVAGLKAAKRPLIIAGASLQSAATLQAAANIITALGEQSELFLVLPECNSLGVSLLGGMHANDALTACADADTVIVLENDLYQRASQTTVDAALAHAKDVILIDHSVQATLAKASVVLPAGTFAEADGTLVNNEGRAQRYFQVYAPEEEDIQESWRWCKDLMAQRGAAPDWRGLDDVIAALCASEPILAPIRDAAPDAKFKQAGLRFARAPHRATGRTVLYADQNVNEKRPRPDPDSALTFSMEGWPGQRPAALLPFAWAPGWNSNQQAITRFQDEVAGPLKGGDPGAWIFTQTRDAQAKYFDAQITATDGWQTVPLAHIFGSEPLSVLAPAIAERTPAPYFGLNLADAERLNVAADDKLTLPLHGALHSLPVRIIESLPAGCIGVPVGLAGLQGLNPVQTLTL